MQGVIKEFMSYKKVKQISVNSINKEFKRIWQAIELLKGEEVIDPSLIDEFEQVKAKAESLGIQVRSNSKIETLKEKIAEIENA